MHRIAVIPGDGIGPEVIAQGVRLLEVVSKTFHFDLKLDFFPWGGNHYLKTREIFPEQGIKQLQEGYSAIYLGALGDPRVPLGLLERGILLKLRKELDLYVNLRPLKLYHERYTPLKHVSSFDILVVRENTEDLYTGPQEIIKKGTSDEVRTATAFYSRKGVERIVRYAFERAKTRHKKLTLCDKANAVPAQEIWREVFTEVGREYHDVHQEFIYVDACAMALVSRPHEFDVIVTTNLFGDILTDLGSVLCGGIGLAPSANIHPNRFGLFEPIHGSAPKLVGTKKANPIGAILAASMLLDFLGETKGAHAIENAVEHTLQSGKIPSSDSHSSMETEQITSIVLDSLHEFA